MKWPNIVYFLEINLTFKSWQMHQPSEWLVWWRNLNFLEDCLLDCSVSIITIYYFVPPKYMYYRHNSAFQWKVELPTFSCNLNFSSRITTLHSDLQILENLCVKQHASAVAVRERLQYSEANSSSGLSRQPTNASRQPTRTASISSISRVPTSTNTTLSRQPTLTKS